MRVVIDAMGAPSNSGGMRVHAEEFIAAWLESFPNDELVLVGNPWLDERFGDNRKVRTEIVRGGGIVSRFTTQVFGTSIVRRRHRADAVLSLSTVVTPFAPASRTACFVHDWRHLRHAEEFGRAQRLYRHLWRLSVRRAGLTFAISDKTHEETLQFTTPRELLLAENGADHPRRWAQAEIEAPDSGTGARLLTFGHLPNKRPELAVAAMPAILQHAPDAVLTVVGARGDYADSIAALAERLGVSHAVELPGFVSDSHLHSLIQRAHVVALLSSDEGYGFPVVEADYFGVPVVVASDSGLEDIHRARAVIGVDPDPAVVAAGIRDALSAGIRPRREHVEDAWSATVGVVRDAMVRVASSADAGR